MADIRLLVQRMVQPVWNRIMMLIARGVLEAVSDDKNLQLVKMDLLEGENRDGLERFQNYGFTSNPKPGAEGIILFPSGNREHGIVVCIDDRRFRLKGLKSGEVALYTDEGDFIHFLRGGIIKVKASTKVILETPLVETTAKMKVGSDLEVVGKADVAGVVTGSNVVGGGTSLATIKSVFNTHTHPETGVTTGATTTPL